VPDREEQRDRGVVERVTVATWVWGKKYGPEYLTRFLRGVNDNLSRPHDVCIFHPQEEDRALTEVDGCFARLRAFDPEWQAQSLTGRTLFLDLDLIITGALDPLFDGPDPFRILQGVNSSNPCPYNGSVWRLDPGYRPDVWADFSLEAAALVPHDSFPDDQAWFAHKLPGAAAYTDADGVYAFQKRCWPRGEALPKNAKLVAFPGWRDPVGFQHLDWVKAHWRA